MLCCAAGPSLPPSLEREREGEAGPFGNSFKAVPSLSQCKLSSYSVRVRSSRESSMLTNRGRERTKQRQVFAEFAAPSAVIANKDP